jgi:hypothetical protein
MRWPQFYRYLLSTHLTRPFCPFTVMLVLATMELVAYDMHADETHAHERHAYEMHDYEIHARERGTS